MKPTLAIIGGSGLYAMPGLQDVHETTVDTPFGAPSGPVRGECCTALAFGSTIPAPGPGSQTSRPRCRA